MIFFPWGCENRGDWKQLGSFIVGNVHPKMTGKDGRKRIIIKLLKGFF